MWKSCDDMRIREETYFVLGEVIYGFQEGFARIAIRGNNTERC